MNQPSATTTIQSDRDVVAATYQAFAVGDVPSVLAVFSEHITWQISGRNPLSGKYAGQDEVLAFFQALGERSNGTFTLEIHDILDNGRGTVLALVTEHAERNGTRLDDLAVHYWCLADARVTSFRGFTSDDHAQDAFWS